MSTFLKKILWATDFSDEAQEAFLYARNFAKGFQANLVALHVVPDFSPTLYNTSLAIRGELVKRADSLEKEAIKKLENVKKKKAISFKILDPI